ncbi:AMP-binding protein [Actinomadura sp. 3N407]|uniref:AMP-binding protein n=1 Tax=Actinomadura sp. 3N407 TaxID=3457423 RepID=UPI003FCEA229
MTTAQSRIAAASTAPPSPSPCTPSPTPTSRPTPECPATPPRCEHVLCWLDHPGLDESVHFSDGRGTWTGYSYAALAAGARRNAHLLRTAGIGSGDIVLLIGGNTPGFVMSLFGVLHAGATPSIVAPAVPAELADRLTTIVGTISPAALLAAPEPAPLLDDLLRPLGCRVLAEAPEDAPMDDTAAEPPDVALVQFSSGSTGAPRGVQIPWPTLNAHVRALDDWLSITGASRVVSWMPFFHDMGLVGCLLLPMARGAAAWYLRPEEFIGAPDRWLAEITRVRGTATALPAFAMGHVLRRLRPAQLDKYDLGSLQSLIVGAERVDPDVLDAFHRLLTPLGLPHRALLPAYGMAEATLAVTGIRPSPEKITTRVVDMEALEPGKPVTFAAGDARLDDDPRPSVRLISCGRPLAGVGVQILDDGGAPLPEGVFGEIAVSGDGLAAGYLERELVPFGDRHRTGDMGFILGGELYVVGRAGDAIKVRGRWLFADDVQTIAAAASPKPQRTVALLGSLSGQDTAVVTVEDCTAEEAAAVGRAVAAKLPGLRVTVLLTPHGTLQRTTSGKPRRRAMWQDLVAAGAPSAHRVWDSAADRA